MRLHPLFEQRQIEEADLFDAADDAGAQFGTKAQIAAAMALLGAGERHVGILVERVGRVAIGAEERAAQRDVDGDAMGAHRDFAQHGREDAPRRRFELSGRGAVADDDGELVAREAEGIEVGCGPRGAAADGGDDGVAGGMADGVVDLAQVGNVEQKQAEGLAGRHRIAEDLVEPGPVGQARQFVDIGAAVIGDADVLVLDGERAEVEAGLDDLPLEGGGTARLPEIEREGGAHFAGPVDDGIGPAGPEAERQGQGLVVVPERIGGDVGDFDGGAAIGGGAAGADDGPDGDTFERGRILRGQARAGERMKRAIGHEQDRAQRLGRASFGTLADQQADRLERGAAGDRFEHFGLQLQQLF